MLGLVVIMVAMAAAIAIRRLHRDYTTARYERRISVLRPRLLRLLSEDEPDLHQLDEMAGLDGRLLEGLVWSLLNKVRGSSRVALVEWLDRRGAIEVARRRTHRMGAVGRAKSAERLGAAGLESTSDDVVALLADRNPEVRIVAARSLGKLGDPRSVGPLLDALDGQKSVPVGLVSMAIIHIGPSAVDELILGLGRRSANARMVSAELLGLHGAFQAARYLIHLLNDDPSDDVRLRAAGALGRLGAPQGVDPLSRALAPSHPLALRMVAARSLGQIGGSHALASLQIELSDPDHRMANAAGEALASMGGPGIEILVTVAEGEGDSARRAEDWLLRSMLNDKDRRRRARSTVTPTTGGHYK